jgi:uncharacterized LabA/DUF88 family protein
MNLDELKRNYYLFDPKPFGRIFVFVDFGNVRPWAKEFWPEENKYHICAEIDIKKLSEFCDLVAPVTKFFYYGFFAQHIELDRSHPLNAKYRSSIYRIDKARKSGFSVRSKEIKMIPHYDEDGKFLGKTPKYNFDVEIALDAMKKIEQYDTVMLFSGDSDFGKLLGYFKSKGKKIIVVSTRSRMSIELERVADKFIPAEAMKDLLRYDNKNNTTPLVGA